MTDTVTLVARRVALPLKAVAATIDLLDQGATVPFISRYRKEHTGSLDEVEIRKIETALAAVRQLEARKLFVLDAIENAGGLTPELRERIEASDSLTEVEDLYAPFKPKRRTRATVAREKGLEPLAKIIMAGHSADCSRDARRFVGKNEVENVEQALAGAQDIIAEWASESERLRNMTRNTYRRNAVVSTSVAKDKEQALAESPYVQYFDFSQHIRRIASHQFLALKRAEREGLIKAKFDFKDDSLDQALAQTYTPKSASDSCADLIQKAVTDASKRLLRPSVENEMWSQLKEEADRVAIDIFSQNLRQLLLAAPLKGKRVLAIDPGYRTGCKVVALDEQGKLLADAVIYPTAPKNDIEGAQRIVSDLIDKHRLEVVALGNGTASRETERFLKGTRLLDSNKIFIVSEDGASVYSASDVARYEFPDKDVTVRGAVSIGRRLIDPMAELVKIDPKSIGVGQYQHDVDQSQLKDSLDFTVMSCVNAVGVDVNTASEQLLSYISGIGPALAANIVKYRSENGSFATRKDLLKVPRLGQKAFELAAGFLRVPGGDEPLDNTGIHPESYSIVLSMARSIGVDVAQLPANSSLLDSIDVDKIVAQGAGAETVRDIIAELRKPGRDPRTDDNSEAFVPAIDDFSQLKVGMILPGLVNNITAFGAFIDLGIKENGLVHISHVAKKRVTAVGDVLKLGQQVQVKVIDFDDQRRRISLSIKDV